MTGHLINRIQKQAFYRFLWLWRKSRFQNGARDSVSTTLCPSPSQVTGKSNTDGNNMRKIQTEPSKPGDLKEACAGGGAVWRSADGAAVFAQVHCDEGMWRIRFGKNRMEDRVKAVIGPDSMHPDIKERSIILFLPMCCFKKFLSAKWVSLQQKFSNLWNKEQNDWVDKTQSKTKR